MKEIAEREKIHFDVLGDVLDPKMGINIYYGDKVIVENYDYPKEIPKRDYHLQTNYKKLKPFPENYFMKENNQYEYIYNLENDFFKVLSV